MAVDNCLLALKQARFGLKDEEALELIDDLRSKKNHLMKKPDWQVKFRRQINEMSADAQFVARQKRLQRKLQVVKDYDNLKRLNVDPKQQENFSAFLVGSTEKKFENADAVWTNQHAQASLRVGRILTVLGGGNSSLSMPSVMGKFPFGRGLFDQKEFQEAVIEELFPFTGKQKTKNDLAFKMAEAVNKEQRELVNLANAEGAAIGWLDDFVTTQYHDLTKIKAATYAKWKQDIEPLLNEDKTFKSGEAQDRENFLQTVYDNIVQNRKAIVDAAPEEVGMGSKSLATMMSQHRQLHFKDSQAWLKYNSLYGHDNPIEAILSGIERMSANTVLMQKFGANPDFTFDKYLNSMPDLSQGERRVIKSQYEFISGKAHQVGDPTLHKWEQGLSAMQNLSKLGTATISATTDPMYSAFATHYRGKNIFSSYFETYKTGLMQSPFWRTAGRKERRETMRKIGIAIDGVIGSASMRFDPNGGGPGLAQRMTNNFFKWTGLNGWTNWWSEGAGVLLADDFAEATRRPFGELNKRFQEFLGNYGITEQDWEVLSTFEPMVSGDAKLFTPELIYRDLEEKIESIPKPTKEDKIAFRTQRDLADKLQNLFITENENSIIRPGGRERAFMMRVPFGGDDVAKPGTPSGMAAKLFWQFRSFGLSMVIKNYPRVKDMGMPAFMHLLPMVTLGYAAYTAKGLMRGREPVDPREDMETFLKVTQASVLQAGFGGIFGDFIFNDYRKFGSSIADVAGGPTVATAQDIAEMFSALARAEDPAAQTWNVIKNNHPYANFWLTRTLSDYFIHYQIQEMLNPGYLRRMEKRYKSQYNQDFIDGYAPSDIVR